MGYLRAYLNLFRIKIVFLFLICGSLFAMGIPEAGAAAKYNLVSQALSIIPGSDENRDCNGNGGDDSPFFLSTLLSDPDAPGTESVLSTIPIGGGDFFPSFVARFGKAGYSQGLFSYVTTDNTGLAQPLATISLFDSGGLAAHVRFTEGSPDKIDFVLTDLGDYDIPSGALFHTPEFAEAGTAANFTNADCQNAGDLMNFTPGTGSEGAPGEFFTVASFPTRTSAPGAIVVGTVNRKPQSSSSNDAAVYFGAYLDDSGPAMVKILVTDIVSDLLLQSDYDPGDMSCLSGSVQAPLVRLVPQLGFYDGDDNTDLAVGVDYDEEKYADAMVAVPEDFVRVYPGNGDGTFGASVDHKFGNRFVMFDLEPIDLDGDGQDELAVSFPTFGLKVASPAIGRLWYIDDPLDGSSTRMELAGLDADHRPFFMNRMDCDANPGADLLVTTAKIFVESCAEGDDVNLEINYLPQTSDVYCFPGGTGSPAVLYSASLLNLAPTFHLNDFNTPNASFMFTSDVGPMDCAEGWAGVHVNFFPGDRSCGDFGSSGAFLTRVIARPDCPEAPPPPCEECEVCPAPVQCPAVPECPETGGGQVVPTGPRIPLEVSGDGILSCAISPALGAPGDLGLWLWLLGGVLGLRRFFRRKRK